MAEKTPPQASSSSNLNIHPPPPSSNAGSTSNAPFTPRSTTFPDGWESDSEFDSLEPTPTHSPGGPRYDDLPPTYDEAQQQALQDARAGIPPLDPNHLEVHRMVLNEGAQQPSSPEHAQPQGSTSGSWSDDNRTEFQQGNQCTANGLGMNVPVQQVAGSEHIPIGQTYTGHVAPAQSTPSAPDPTSVLLDRALEFTRHDPDADARYASRLTRSIAIPQEGLPSLEQEHANSSRRHRRCGGRRERGGGPPWAQRRNTNRMPGQWPEAASSETLDAEPTNNEEPVRFLRAYAKALHAHSIRPAEFTDFLDGLNALCLATNTTANDLLHEEPGVDSSSIVRSYIDATNEAFFAPRGLKVSLKSLSTVVNALRIPEERGQRAGAVASALDDRSTSEQRALALHPWIERLSSVPEPSAKTMLLREMGERFRRQSFLSSRGTLKDSEHAQPRNEEKARPANEAFDPPHSVPDPPPGAGGPSFPPGPGAQGFPFRPGHHGRGWGPGSFPWCPPPHNASPFAHPWGNQGWGGRGSHPWAAPGGRGFGPRGPQPNVNNPDWAAFGESIGKWGEDFGKRMEEWGEQFGKRAEEWGNGYGRRAEIWAGNVAASAAGGRNVPRRGQSSNDAGPSATASGAEGPARQEMDGYPPDYSAHKAKGGKGKGNVYNDDDDASSISSDSSSDSDSDSESPYPDTHALFLSRVREINIAAEHSRAKGKKSEKEISRERDLAIEKAQSQCTAMDIKIEQKKEKRAQKKELRRKKRDIKKEHRGMKRDLKGAGGGDGKEARELKREIQEEYRRRKEEHRRVKEERRKEWRQKREERRRERREGRGARRGRDGEGSVWREREEGMVWVVVENLGSG